MEFEVIVALKVLQLFSTALDWGFGHKIFLIHTFNSDCKFCLYHACFWGKKKSPYSASAEKLSSSEVCGKHSSHLESKSEAF